jgi:hypothetical protein
MNLNKTLSLGILALAVVLIAAAPANAQQVLRGTFNLPFEAQIGSTIVEPGQYEITLEECLGQKLIRLHPANGSSDLTFLTGSSSHIDQRDNSVLKFVNVNGLERLRTMESGALGESFTFPLWKLKGEHSARVGAETSVVVGTR